MKEEIFQRIVKEMKALIRQETEERDNSQDMEAMEEHEEVSADPFAELCDTTRLTRRTTWKRTSRRSCWLGRGARRSRTSQPKYRDQWVTLFIKYNTGIPKLSSSGAIIQHSWGRPEAKEGVPQSSSTFIELSRLWGGDILALGKGSQGRMLLADQGAKRSQISRGGNYNMSQPAV
ncbi:hypothetical protein GWK47_019927 [Chionoecetes opilio]|uniref:Uncharacterized protein n=1 Tax=Chionoecetes opilio TaxID=41210 RepID=A0A8J4XQI6_CHIOP|nr:hypothetical protein GWK47_019927 [Chionoecetes opilio]